jgi:hypothetical protein
MATTDIVFSTTKSKGIDNYLISVDGKPRKLDKSGRATVTLQTGSTHALTWHMWGESQAYIGITGTNAAGKDVVKVAKTKIREGGSQGFGGIQFDL